MTEHIMIPAGADKAGKYEALLPQLEALVHAETDLIANLANIAAVLKDVFGFFWVGFYLVKEGQLVLGPFQGPLACTRIAFGMGVCGKAWETGQTQLIPDVDAFPGHIACSADSRSEIVVPIRKADTVVGVLDIDSDKLAGFDATDQKYLEMMVSLVPT
ncbi:GAF domain-containing protein [Cyclobacterium lianum]|uniref:GAF domain-containing protein n=1 Tax=Cyclobacterium lianum TaxID=388280 RepID=A0A1M7I1J8_9BACT|nr:GAF domain-containing protein [Cyclobacterium lianum]SHM34267.1 GAF domain-containing protein [Cyclobacterium lianum]